MTCDRGVVLEDWKTGVIVSSRKGKGEGAWCTFYARLIMRKVCRLTGRLIDN